MLDTYHSINKGCHNIANADIFIIYFPDIHTISIVKNWLPLFGILILIFVILWLIPKKFKRCVEISETTLGIGNNSITLKYNKKDREIAYKLWVELATRKIGIPFTENDIIVEVYNSWYECFGITRKLLAELPVNQINATPELYYIMINVLNRCLREHLTTWHAQFRHWYDIQEKNDPKIPPQQIQQQYPFYNSLVEDLKTTNLKIQNYMDALESIARGKRG